MKLILIGWGDKMYKCNNCGETFTDPEKEIETHGLSTPPYEEYTVSPCCGSGYAEYTEPEPYEYDIRAVVKNIISAISEMNIYRKSVELLYGNKVDNKNFENASGDLISALDEISAEEGMDASVFQLMGRVGIDKTKEEVTQIFLDGAGL